MTDDPSLSDEGYVAALSGGAALLLALLAAAGGESSLAVVPALLAGTLGLLLAIGDTARDRAPGKRHFLVMAVLAAGAAVVSLRDEQLFSAAGLGAVAVMTFARSYQWRVGGDDEGDEDAAGEADADE